MLLMTVKEYIDTYYNGNQSAFARVQGAKRQQVARWIEREFLVINGQLYSSRRKLIKK